MANDTNRPFDFNNYGNLYFYHKGKNFFYFNYLLNNYERNAPNLGYLTMKHNIGQEQKSILGTPNLSYTKNTEDIQFSDDLNEIITILNNAIAYEKNNEIKYITQQYNKFIQSFTQEEIKLNPQIQKIMELFNIIKNSITNTESYSTFSNDVYNQIILLINFLLQGIDNTLAILEFEQNRMTELNTRMNKIQESYERQIKGLAVSTRKYNIESAEFEQYMNELNKRREIHIQNLYALNPSLSSARGFSSLEGIETADVKIGRWITQRIKKILDDQASLKLLHDNIETELPNNTDQQQINYILLAQKIRPLIIRLITTYAINNMDKILKDELKSLDTKELVKDSINNYSQALNFNISGLYENFGLQGRSVQFFKSPIEDIQQGQASAAGLYEAAKRFKQKIQEQNKKGQKLSANQKKIKKALHIHQSDDKDTLSEVFKLLEALEAINETVKKQNLTIEEDKQKILEQHFLIRKGRRTKQGKEQDITISLQIVEEDGKVNVTLTPESQAILKQLTFDNGKKQMTFADLFNNMQYRNLRSLITTMKRRVSKQIADTITQEINRTEIPEATLAEIERGLAPINVSISGPTLSEIKQGIQQELQNNGSISSIWTGKLNVKNDFITVTVDAPLESFTINFTDLTSNIIQHQLTAAQQQFTTNFQEINREVVTNIQTQMRGIAKQRTFTDYAAMAKQFNELSKQRDNMLLQAQQEIDDTIKALFDSKQLTDQDKKAVELLQKKQQAFANQFKNSLYISSTMKTYNAYQNNVGFTGGSLGVTLIDQLDSLNTLFAQAGLPLSQDTYEWLLEAIINCSPYSVTGTKNKDLIETVLGSLAIFSLFNEGGAELELVRNSVQEALDSSNMNILHLYGLNGTYYPGSYVLAQVLTNIQEMSNILQGAEHQAHNIFILNTIHPGDMPNTADKLSKNNSAIDRTPWETVSQLAIEKKVTLKVVFMAGLVDIVNDLRKAAGEIELP